MLVLGKVSDPLLFHYCAPSEHLELYPATDKCFNPQLQGRLRHVRHVQRNWLGQVLEEGLGFFARQAEDVESFRNRAIPPTSAWHPVWVADRRDGLYRTGDPTRRTNWSSCYVRY
ncbi:unnamed protein product [Durusdinium trenchii]|uniref:Uncharacterized protein n=1 Tax=Durusdinium trenchii TaxID=1381693 RepID=A0ABP0RSQ8_9DINO